MKHIFGKLSVILIIGTIFFSSCTKDNLISPISSTKDLKELSVEQTYIKDGASVILYAGQTQAAGTIDISIQDNNLLVTYNTSNGFELLEAHLFIGNSLSEMPQTKNGNPKIGNFPYTSGSLNGITSYTFSIPLSTFGSGDQLCDKSLVIAAHASLQKILSTGGYQYETGWGDGLRMVQQGNWATYYTFSFGCQIDDPDPDPTGCETAFGYSERTFIDFGLTQNRWGWVIEIEQDGGYSTPIYAAAGNNIITNGYHVGNLIYSKKGNYIVVSYEMFNGFSMSETHLYVSNNPPTTIAPGQYGNIHTLSSATSDIFTFNNLSGGKVYVIAHAVVCSSDF